MANSIKPTDLYSTFNSLILNATGSTFSTLDMSSAITVGQAAQLYGYENTLNALSSAMGRVLIAARPYKATYGLVESDSEAYGQIMRKISYFYDGFEPEESWNTDLSSGQLNDGTTVDAYKIRKRYPLEMHFGGMKVLQKSYTRFLSQLKVAFSNAEDFERFYRGEAIQISNEIQMMKEAENMALVINAMAATYNTGMNGMKINLVTAFNDVKGTSYTSSDLLGAHLKEFTQFFVSTFKYLSDMFTKNTALYHLAPNKTNDAGQKLTLLRHTPKNKQRLLLNSQLWYDVESMVFPEIFNDNYLKLEQAELLPYWQSAAGGDLISATPNQFDVETGLSKTGEPVKDLRVVGLLYDADALAVSYRQENVLTTPINARGNYYNTVYHWAKDYRYDPTENMVLFYMKDGEV